MIRVASIAVILAVAVAACSPTDQDFASDDQYRMLVVIEALESYHSDHDAYPENLGSLVPAYVGREPLNRLGDPFDYAAYASPDRFFLGSGYDAGCGYTSGLGWDCTGGH